MRVLAEKVREAFRKFKIQEERTLDGLKLVFSDGSWVMFRPSGTEPKTRLYCESKDPQLLDAIVQLGTQCIESSK
jgi:phosphomannomutase